MIWRYLVLPALLIAFGLVILSGRRIATAALEAKRSKVKTGLGPLVMGWIYGVLAVAVSFGAGWLMWG